MREWATRKMMAGVGQIGWTDCMKSMTCLLSGTRNHGRRWHGSDMIRLIF